MGWLWAVGSGSSELCLLVLGQVAYSLSPSVFGVFFFFNKVGLSICLEYLPTSCLEGQVNLMF